MIQLIVIIAAILLGMFIYPIWENKFNRFITDHYKRINKKTEENEIKIPLRKDEKPSFVGESKYKVGHSRTKVATDLETEKEIEKASIFAPSADENPEMTAVKVPLEKIEKLSEEEFDDDTEAVGIETEKDAVLASGAQFDELQKVSHVLVNKEASSEEKEIAGRVVYENRKTDMFEQLASGNYQISQTISSLIDLHLAKRAERLNQKDEKRYPESFQDFDINSIF